MPKVQAWLQRDDSALRFHLAMLNELAAQKALDYHRIGGGAARGAVGAAQLSRRPPPETAMGALHGRKRPRRMPRLSACYPAAMTTLRLALLASPTDDAPGRVGGVIGAPWPACRRMPT